MENTYEIVPTLRQSLRGARNRFAQGLHNGITLQCGPETWTSNPGFAYRIGHAIGRACTEPMLAELLRRYGG